MTDFPTSSPTDMKPSLQRFLQIMDGKVGQDDDTADILIYPGHGTPTNSLKREKESNPFLQEFIHS